MPSIFRTKTWTPTAGIVSAVLQVIAMLVSTAIARMGAFKPTFRDLFGMWAMRPRIGWMTLIWLIFSHEYKWTVLDIVLTECLLNILALPYAIRFLDERNLDRFGCQIDGYRPAIMVNTFAGALGFNVFAGVASGLVLAPLTVVYLTGHTKWFKHPKPRRTSRGHSFDHSEDSSDFHDDDSASIVLAVGCGGFVMIGTFISDWVLWGQFIHLAGDAYCPSGIIGIGVTWGLSLLTIAILRPTFGGGPSG